MSTDQTAEFKARVESFKRDFEKVRAELKKVIVGHENIIDGVVTSLFVGGHILLEGVPGLGKTLLVRTLSEAVQLDFSRVQFTPDLMPADILGTNVVMETPDGRRAFEFQRGPIFAQIVLADEINRATPKTQSALLEAMQEQSVTIGGTIHKLKKPFFVMATQNPIEQEGTYPLPEAQLDRFLFKLVVGYSSREELNEILDRTTRGVSAEIRRVIDGDTLIAHQSTVRQVLIAPHIQDYAVRLVLGTHPGGQYAPEITNRFIRWGSSPRGAQTLVLASKSRALLEGRFNVSFEDIRRSLLPSLRHRILLNFEAQAEGKEADDILLEILKTVPEMPENKVSKSA
ncbi:MAG: AAA family ATPase [Isosphaeraceae bacterium]